MRKGYITTKKNYKRMLIGIATSFDKIHTLSWMTILRKPGMGGNVFKLYKHVYGKSNW